MSVMTFIKGLLPSFESSKVKDGLRLAAEDLASKIAPIVKNLVRCFDRNWKYKNKDAKWLIENIHVKVNKLPPNASLFEKIDWIISNLGTTIPFIQTELDRKLSREVAIIGLSYSKANLLQYCEIVTFFKQYVTIFVNFISAAELNAIDGKQRVEGVGPDDVEWLRAKYAIFITACRILSYEVNALKTELSRIPDMTIDSTTEKEANIIIGSSKLDPFGFASLPFPISLLYHLRLRGVESDAEEYEDLKATATAIEYRIILLKQRIDSGSGDAALEKQLSIQEDRLLTQRRRLAKLEEQYGL